MERNREYTTPAKLLHWAMAAVIAVAWVIGFYASTLTYGVDANKGWIITLHKSVATITLFLIVLRILWRATHRPPELVGFSPLMRAAAHGGHALLYVLMIILPLSGWVWSSAAGYDIPVAGLFHLPALVAKNKDLASVFSEIHETLAWFTGAVVVGHVLFALKHQIVDRDGTLRAMMLHR